MAFPPLGNSDHVVVLVSTDFPINSKQDALFHHLAYDYSRADWDGLCDHLRDVPWEDIFKGCVLYIFTSLFFKSKLEHLPNWERCFLFHFKSSFHSQENQILEFYILKFHDAMKCLSIKQEIHFTE